MLISVTIEGLTPIIFDRFANAILEGRTTAQTANKKTDLSPTDQARAKLYLYEGTDRPYLPATYLFRAIVDAGRLIKVGKRQLSTRDETIIPSFLSLVGIDFPIESREGWRVDARGIVNQKTKDRVLCYRPIFDDWRVSFELDLDENEGRVSVVRELVDKAGRAIGMGVMRPSRKGNYGQFKVVSWEVVEASTPTAVAAE